MSPCFDAISLLSGKCLREAAAIVNRTAVQVGAKVVEGLAAIGTAFIPGPADDAARISLFRAVSKAEAADITATGGFRASANSLGGKWFATSAEDAGKWGAKFYGNEPFSIVETRVTQGALNSMMRLQRLDQIGPAVYAEINQLSGATVRIIR